MDRRALTEDTYFLDRDLALRVASFGNCIRTANGETEIQLCYYDGAPFPDGPSNLVHLPVETISSFFSASGLRLPTHLSFGNLNINEEARETARKAFGELLATIAAQRESAPATSDRPIHQDTYFTDPEMALRTALACNPVELGHPTIHGVQLCYYPGPPFANAPENLVAVSLENIEDFFSETRLRLPSQLILDPRSSEDERRHFLGSFQKKLEKAQIRRSNSADALLNTARSQGPGFTPDQPYRIFLPTSRCTTVMQYVTKHLASAFERLGHRTRVVIEENAMEAIDPTTLLREQVALAPHIVININHLNNALLHPDVFNITWWQDPMQEISDCQKLPWRDRDIVFSIGGQIDEYLRATDAPQIYRQHFCADTEVFSPGPEEGRTNKVVFVGSSYRRRLHNTAQEKIAIAELNALLTASTPITDERLRSISERLGLDFQHLYWNVFHYVVRDTTVRWLCQYSPIPVEIYGRFWDEDPVVSPHNRGEVNHGAELAELYRSSRYAMVSHPFHINSQRLAEVAACGTNPVLFDCRPLAEGPFWERNVLYFDTPDSLAAQLQSTTERPSQEIATHFTYDRLARRIIDIVDEHLKDAMRQGVSSAHG